MIEPMAPPTALHVHLAADGGICVVGPGQSSTWVTLDELRRRLEHHRGSHVVLSGKPSAPAVRPARDLIEELAGTVRSGPAPAETRRPNRTTALMAAAAYGALHLLDDLLARGVKLEAKDSRQLTALHHAAGRGQTEAVRRLLDAGARIEARTVEGKTPLWNAAAYGHPETVQLLLERGADPVALGKDGVDARGWAAVRGHDDVVALLPDSEVSLVRTDGETIGVRRGGWIPWWFGVFLGAMLLYGVGQFGGRFDNTFTSSGDGGSWWDALGWLVILAVVIPPMYFFELRRERGDVPSLLVDGDGIEVGARRGRERVPYGAITTAAVKPSARWPKRIRLDHAGGTTIVPLKGRPHVAVIELLHRCLAEHGIALVGGWHLAFTGGSVDPVKITYEPRPAGPDQERG